MGRKGRPKKRKVNPKIKYKIGDTVMVNIFGHIKEGVVEEIDSLEGIRVYNIITKLSQTKYPYVGVDGSGNFWNIDSKLTKIKKQSNGKR
jgi:hypothetical protein|tara:strand:- start:1637 stop:1906 length:270 start_codon:yes stop_codon:yes gene_type:complete